MARDEQLQWEARAGRVAAAAAILSALLGMVSLAIGQQAKLLAPADDQVEILLREHAHKGALIATSVVQGISVLLLAVVLAYLYKAAKHRRPEVPSAALPLALILPPLTAVLAVVHSLLDLKAADRLIPQLPLAPKAAIKLAEHEATKGAAQVVGYVGAAAGVALAFTIGMLAINARRAGLLSQFMGILGVIVGVLLVIPILGPPIVQFFWLVALALIFLDRWPGGGRGPAWESGEAIPWPTAVEARAAAAGGSAPAPAARREPPRWLQRLGAAAPADENGSGTPQPAPLDDYENDGAPAGSPHPRSKKRKRKRRR